MRENPIQPLLTAVVTALLLGACASALPGYSPDAKVQAAQAKAAQDAENAGTFQDNGSYVLGPDEAKLDCRKLTGRMQVRILQIRDHNERQVGSAAGQTIQSVATPVFGGTTYGANPDRDFARDRAILEAYNRQLAAKNCKTFDLAAELKPKPVKDTPTPIAKPK